MYCEQCGAQVSDDEKVCPYCGSVLNGTTAPQTMETQTMQTQTMETQTMQTQAMQTQTVQADTTYTPLQEQPIQQQQNDPKKKKQPAWASAMELIVTMACFKLFGLLETLLGCLAGTLVLKTVGAKYPDKTWPKVLAVVVGVIVAIVSMIFFYTFVLND